jgi:hypothetical protein
MTFQPSSSNGARRQLTEINGVLFAALKHRLVPLNRLWQQDFMFLRASLHLRAATGLTAVILLLLQSHFPEERLVGCPTPSNVVDNPTSAFVNLETQPNLSTQGSAFATPQKGKAAQISAKSRFGFGLTSAPPAAEVDTTPVLGPPPPLIKV